MPTTEPVATVEVDGLDVAVYVEADAKGGKFIRLGGLNCNLEGEQPGVYYPTPIAA